MLLLSLNSRPIYFIRYNDKLHIWYPDKNFSKTFNLQINTVGFINALLNNKLKAEQRETNYITETLKEKNYI